MKIEEIKNDKTTQDAMKKKVEAMFAMDRVDLSSLVPDSKWNDIRIFFCVLFDNIRYVWFSPSSHKYRILAYIGRIKRLLK